MHHFISKYQKLNSYFSYISYFNGIKVSELVVITLNEKLNKRFLL